MTPWKWFTFQELPGYSTYTTWQNKDFKGVCVCVCVCVCVWPTIKICTVKPKYIQTPSTFLTLYPFIRYSLENGKTSQELNKSSTYNFNRKACNGLKSTTNYSAIKFSIQLDNTNLGQLITKQCLILLSLWFQKVALSIKDKKVKQNTVRSKCLNILLIPKCTGRMHEELLGLSQFTLFCYPHLHIRDTHILIYPYS